MTEPDREELQRLAQLVEVNRERLQALEQQIRNLEGIRIEQEHALEALEAIPKEGVNGAMVPLGAGVQLIANIPSDAGAVVDVGSRVQAEKTRHQAMDILKKRNEELLTIMTNLKEDYDELENQITILANRFNETVEGLQETIQKPNPSNEHEQDPLPKRRRRRKRGTELTLDD